MRAWLPTDILPGEVDALIRDDDWCLQEKLDGRRLIVHRTSYETNLYNRNGGLVTPTAQMVRAITPWLPIGYAFDGEWLDRKEEYQIFDILETPEDGDIRSWPTDRRIMLMTLKASAAMAWPISAALSNTVAGVRILPTHLGTARKRKMLERLHQEDAEGAIFKQLSAPYTPGRPLVGGTMRRLKFRKTADVILQRRPPGHDESRSFEAWIFDKGQPRHIGSVNANRGESPREPHFYDRLEPGEVIVGEVSYLHVSDNYNLIQPTIVRLRDDKDPEACTIDQLVVGKRYTCRSTSSASPTKVSAPTK